MEPDDTAESVGISSIWRLYKLPIMIFAGSFFLVAISGIMLVKSGQTTTPIEFSENETLGASASAMMVSVDVQGAVARPGLYELPAGSRVGEAIDQAGGLAGDADEERIARTINRAAKIIDGGKIYVPKVETNNASHIPVPQTTSYNINSLGTEKSQNGTVNINFATQSELESLSGVGPVTAQKIISGRPYQTLEELVSKKAMSQSLFTKLRDQLSL